MSVSGDTIVLYMMAISIHLPYSILVVYYIFFSGMFGVFDKFVYVLGRMIYLYGETKKDSSIEGTDFIYWWKLLYFTYGFLVNGVYIQRISCPPIWRGAWVVCFII